MRNLNESKKNHKISDRSLKENHASKSFR